MYAPCQFETQNACPADAQTKRMSIRICCQVERYPHTIAEIAKITRYDILVACPQQNASELRITHESESGTKALYHKATRICAHAVRL